MDDIPLEELLAAMPVFEGLTPRQLEEVAGTVLGRRVKQGKAIIKEGNWGHEFLIVLDGQIDIVRDGQIVDTTGPGSFVGEVAVLHDVRRNATVVARTPVVVGAIDTGLFRALVSEIPLLSQRLAALGRGPGTPSTSG